MENEIRQGNFEYKSPKEFPGGISNAEFVIFPFWLITIKEAGY